MKKKGFYKMLYESNLPADAKWHKENLRFYGDSRFKDVDEKYREDYFQDYLDDLYKKL